MKLTKNIFLKCLGIAIVLATIFSCSACGKISQYNNSITYHSDTSVVSLDPQLAATTAELTAIANCFEGLMRLDEKGNIVCGSATDYNISKDLLTYTFTLKDDLLWSDGKTPVTANDIVFGLTRAVLPETKAPYASLLFSIKNAKQIYDGKKRSSEIGVKAVSNYKLQITLSSIDYELLNSLSQPVAMPCNKEFFESTNGKYGLDKDFVLSNGAFFLKTWNTETSFLKLLRFDDYNGNYPAIPASVIIGFDREIDTVYTNLLNNNIDVGNVECENVSSLESAGCKSYYYYNTSYSLFVSPKLSNVSSKIKKVLMLDLDKNLIDLNLPNYIKKSKGILSSGLIERNVNYRKSAGNLTLTSYQPEKASNLLESNISILDTLSSLTLYYPENEDYENIANIIAQTWQKDLGAYINTKAVSESDLLSMAYSGECKLAILPVNSDNNTAYNALRNLVNLKIPTFNTSLNNTFSKNDTEYINNLKSTEQIPIDLDYLYPLFEAPKCYCTGSTIKNIIIANTSDYIIFNFVKSISI